MTVPPSPPPALSEPDVVDALRAAGCVFAEEEARLLLSTADTDADLRSMVRRRADGEPLEHVLGWAQLCGVRLAVGPGVFVPRRRSEFLVQQAAALAPPRPVVLDMCCGVGAVAAVLATMLEGAEIHAADIDPAETAYARRNLASSGGRVYEGDLFEPVPERLRGRVDILVANAPYVPSGAIGTLPPEARDHEPLVALDGGPDGLGVQRRVAAEARRWLAPGGSLLIETSERQAVRTADAMAAGGLAARVAVCEELDATVVIGVVR